MKEETRNYLSKAKEALEEASILLEKGHFDASINRSYYACFYAANALLRESEVELTKHSAVEAALGRLFVKKGLLEKKFHRMFIDLRSAREEADYNVLKTFTKEDASQLLNDASDFYQAIRRIIK